MYLDYFFGTMDSYVKVGMAEGLTSGAGRKDPDDAGRSYLRDAGRGKLKSKAVQHNSFQHSANNVFCCDG